MQKKNKRIPVVSVLGHVDHGKTTLLDAIRKTRVALREKGGITQGIGASVVKTKEGRKITFIDTPGHAAFEKMRSRGAKVADIAILVVAADDGVKPQTKEAIKHIKEAQTPLIVAFTKIDLPTANIESAKGQLEKEGILFEGRGGDTPFIEVSAKTDKGINELLELIILVTDVNEIALSDKFQSIVIETGKDNRGTLVSVVVRSGLLKIGQVVKAGGKVAKIRGLFDDSGVSVREISQGEPCLILGFSEAPSVGSILTFSDSKTGESDEEVRPVTPSVREGETAVLVKASNLGSLEAVLANLPAKIVAINTSIGDVNENDIFLAKASKSDIFTFGLKVSGNIKKLAENEGVGIESFDIIYELIQRLEEIIQSKVKKIFGKASIMAEFPFDGKKIAGCKVVSGVIRKGDNVVLERNEVSVGAAKVISIKKQKEDATKVGQGEEFGALLSPQLDFKRGDMLLSVTNNG